MPEIEEECIFTIAASKVKFTTQTDGDTVIIAGISLTKEQAATMSWLVNHTGNLKIEVKLPS